MSFEANKSGVFSRRVFIVLCFKAVAFILIFGRLFYLQIISHRKYKEQSINNYSKYFIIPPDRGIIYDCHGEKIAYNTKYWRVIHKNILKTPDVIKKTLDILVIPEENQQYILEQYRTYPFEEFIVYEFLSEKQVINIELNLKNLQGIFIDTGRARAYRNSFAYSNLVGYVRYPTLADLQAGVSKHPDIKVGASGLERYFNDTLTGRHGRKAVEVNAYGHKVRDLFYEEPMDGQSLNLTIDAGLQEYMYSLTDKSAMSSVVMDIQTGNILSMISSPTFNSEQISQKISKDDWSSIALNPKKPMFNRAYQARYVLGSVFKIPVAITALKHGIDPKKKFKCTGTHFIGNRLLRCWNEKGHGMVDMHTGIKQSCNIYFYNLAEYIDASQIKAVSHILGLEQIYKNLPLTEQVKGIIPDAHWAKLLQRSWYKGDLANMVIGQGSVMSTTLQLAVMISRFASGKMITPNLIAGSTVIDTPIDIDEEILSIVRNGVSAVVNEPGGTSFWQRIDDPLFRYAGKTGTAQVVSKYVKKGQDYTVEEEKPHGLFVGYAPLINPKYAIATIYENGGYGASSALPFSKKVLIYLKKQYEQQPK